MPSGKKKKICLSNKSIQLQNTKQCAFNLGINCLTHVCERWKFTSVQKGIKTSLKVNLKNMFNAAASQKWGHQKPLQLPRFFCPSFSHSSHIVKFTIKSIPSNIPQLLPFHNPTSPITSPLLQAPRTAMFQHLKFILFHSPLLSQAVSPFNTFPFLVEDLPQISAGAGGRKRARRGL